MDIKLDKFLVFFLLALIIIKIIFSIMNLGITIFTSFKYALFFNNYSENIKILIRNYINLFFIFLFYILMYLLCKFYFSEYKIDIKNDENCLKKYNKGEILLLAISIILVYPLIAVLLYQINYRIFNIPTKIFNIFDIKDLAINESLFSIKYISFLKPINYFIFISIYIAITYIFAYIEEYVFRKQYFANFYRNQNIYVFITINSLFFGIYHIFNLSLTSILTAIFLSTFYLSSLYYLTNNLKLLTFIHFFTNVYILLIGQVFPQFLTKFLVPLDITEKLDIIKIIFLVIIFIIGIILWYFKLGRIIILNKKKQI